MKRFTCDRVIHFPLILGGAMAPSAVSSVSNLRDLEFMPRRVLVHVSLTEKQQFSTNGNSVLDYALLVKLVIITLKQCQKFVMDCVATHSSQHNKLASIICVKLLTEYHKVLTH